MKAERRLRPYSLYSLVFLLILVQNVMKAERRLRLSISIDTTDPSIDRTKRHESRKAFETKSPKSDQ